MERRQFVGLTAGALLARRATAAARPNILYILCDDLGYGDLTCLNPGSRIPTPRIDRLAHEGLTCTDAHSGSAVCTPTRYGVLTGRYCWRTRLKKGVLSGYSPRLVEPGRLTVASLLRAAGYHTACFGKWHLGLDWTTTDGARAQDGGANVDFTRPFRGGPLDCGFDEFFGIAASLDMPPYVYLAGDRAVGVPTEITREGGREGLTMTGFKAVNVLPDLARRTVDYLGRRAADPGRPFFCYLPLNSPHTPIVPTPAAEGRSRAGRYGDFVVATDQAVGQVLDALDRHGLATNTLVILTSDNGSSPHGFPLAEEERTGHHTSYVYRGRKSDAWDGGHRVPFLVRWPGQITPARTSAETICLTDLLATAASLVGVRLPAEAGEDSYDLRPLLRGERLDHPLREATVHHSIQGAFAIRQGPWKLILCAGSGGWSGPKPQADDPPGQLYNLADDVGETRNLYRERSDLVAHLTALLERYRGTGRSRPG